MAMAIWTWCSLTGVRATPSATLARTPRVWLNNGFGAFEDVTAARMPVTPVRFSWDLELLDADGDYDLDIMVSCKSCASQFLFENDSDAYFDDVSDQMPSTTNNYEYAPMDFDGDGDLDAFSINDAVGLNETLVIGDGEGSFELAPDTVFPASENVGADDNVAEWLDVDSDGDPDVIIGSLSGTDRLLTNDQGMSLSLTDTGVFEGAGGTPGTLGMAFADFNGDMKMDVRHVPGRDGGPRSGVFGRRDRARRTAAGGRCTAYGADGR